ncbi:MAG: hypothetical protein KH443_11260, partial [Oscillospiraceae bacterium]|nr:hypothetical protein [Oscillospiraceae bacterium]
SNAAKAARPRRAVGQDLRQLIQNFKYLDCSDLPKQKGNCESSCLFALGSAAQRAAPPFVI